MNLFLEVLSKHPLFNPNQRWNSKKLTSKNKFSGNRNKETLAILCADGLQNISDDSGKALKILCEARIRCDLNIPETNESDTALMRYLRESNSSWHFKATENMKDIVQYMLDHVADPNKPKHMLTYAINHCPFEICEMLLIAGADASSEFRSEDRGLVYSQRNYRVTYSENIVPYEKKFDDSRETALHTAFRVCSPDKVNLLNKYRANEDLTWIGLKPYQLTEIYCTRKHSAYFCVPSSNHNKISSTVKLFVLDTILSRREFMKYPHTLEIKASVVNLIEKVCSNCSELLDEKMVCAMAGSFAEDTKCFAPNEFDFTFTLTENDVTYHKNFARQVYLCIDYLVSKDLIKSSNERLVITHFMHENRIGKLRMYWKKGVLKRCTSFNILVDIAVCDKYNEIAKYSRHQKSDSNQSQESFHEHELQMIHNLSPCVKDSFILAKALRIAKIATPDDVEAFGLQEDIYTDSLITSFILKACLFGKDGIKPEFRDLTKPVDVAIKIYEVLKTALEQKSVVSEYTEERPINCKLCRVERGCCQKRKFMLAMVEKILAWLRVRQSHLKEADSYDREAFV